jgi:MFS family permease
VIGWGTSFNTLTVFGSTLERELALSRETIFAGIAVQLLVSALLAPRIGRLVDRLGARHMMVAGSCVAAFAMLVQSQAQGLASYMLGWVFVGIAAPMMLSNTAMPALVQVVGANARRWITGLTLISGLTSTIFLPINFFLLQTVGWRTAYLIFAALHLAICVPIHWFVVRKGAGVDPTAEGDGRNRAPPTGILGEWQRKRAFVLLAIWTCTEGILTWGLYMQVIDVLQALGVSAGTAVALWTLVGPAQALARFGELLFGARHSILTSALISALLTSSSFLVFLAFGVGTWSTAAFCVLMGLGHGLFAVARNTLPLTLFGAKEFGQYMGLLMVPQNIVNAAAPVLIAAVISRWSPAGALWISGVGAMVGCVAVVMLVRYCRACASQV